MFNFSKRFKTLWNYTRRRKNISTDVVPALGLIDIHQMIRNFVDRKSSQIVLTQLLTNFQQWPTSESIFINRNSIFYVLKYRHFNPSPRKSPESFYLNSTKTKTFISNPSPTKSIKIWPKTTAVSRKHPGQKHTTFS